MKKKENNHPKESLIGRKVKGFKFDSEKYNGLLYAPLMYDYIGEVGEIIKYHSFDNSYRVEFDASSWHYPADLIEQHLVEDNPLDSLPMLGEGVLCEVWDDEHYKSKRYVCARTLKGYIAWAGVYGKEEEEINYSRIHHWKHTQPIEQVKQYTKEQLEKIVGHKFEII